MQQARISIWMHQGPIIYGVEDSLPELGCPSVMMLMMLVLLSINPHVTSGVVFRLK
jgi:hypothetical protein